MDSYRQEIMENFDKYLIGIDDMFAFKCRECGKCCRNREDILLTAKDIYNIAVKLELSILQVIEAYCELYIGRDSRLPIIRLKPKGVNHVCPLLKADHCIVHDHKPVVCALFPIGRVATAADISDGLKPGTPIEVRYINNKASCGSLKRKQTVRSWLEQFGIPAEDPFFIKWNETIISLSESLRQFAEKGVTKKSMELMQDGIATALYAAYDTKKELLPQFQYNADKILEIISALESTLQDDCIEEAASTI